MQVTDRLSSRGAVGGTLAPGVIHCRLPVHFEVLLQLVSSLLLLCLLPGLHLGFKLCPAMLLNSEQQCGPGSNSNAADLQVHGQDCLSSAAFVVERHAL